MTILYRTTDRIEIKIQDITLFVSPLSHHAKMTLLQKSGTVKSEDPRGMLEFAAEMIRLCVKDVRGVSLVDGSEWRPDFSEGKLTDESLGELLSLPMSAQIMQVAGAFMQGIPATNQVIDPSSGLPIEGVEVIQKKAL